MPPMKSTKRERPRKVKPKSLLVQTTEKFHETRRSSNNVWSQSILICTTDPHKQSPPSSYGITGLSIAAREKNYHLSSSMNMPRVVCPTTEWILTKRPSEIISKKWMPRVGDSLRTTKPTLRDHPKSCPNDRNHIADLWMPGLKVHLP